MKITRHDFQITILALGQTDKLIFPANIYLLKVQNKNTRKRFEKCSKLTIKTPEQRHRSRSGVFTLKIKDISHLLLLFLLLTLDR